MNDNNVSTQLAREILVYNTKSNEEGNLTSISTTATTWGELQASLRSENINFKNMAAVIGETSNSLNLKDAIIPSNTFTLFLTPIKTKSGGWDIEMVSSNRLREGIRALKDNNKFGETAREDLKNLKTVGAMRKAVDLWCQDFPQHRKKYFKEDVISISKGKVVVKKRNTKTGVTAKAAKIVKTPFHELLDEAIIQAPNNMFKNELRRVLAIYRLKSGQPQKALASFKSNPKVANQVKELNEYFGKLMTQRGITL